MRRLLAAAVALLAAGPGAAATRPNFIVITLDDTRVDGIDRMPTVQARLVGEGITFTQAFVPNPLCCPSRASLLTGLYSIRHGARTLAPPLGGAPVFRTGGADRQTIAVWLRQAGYATGLFGKYLNDYARSEAHAGPQGTFYVPPGWERWRAMVKPEGMGGKLGATYRIVDEGGRVTTYDHHGDDSQYSTDVLAAFTREFIADAVRRGVPFFAYWATFASHGDPFYPAAAERHATQLADLPLWRPPSWNEADVSDKPRWVAALAAVDAPAHTDQIRRRAYQSLLAVDEGIAAILDDLERLGVADSTIVIFTSDNGVTWGEHRSFFQFKDCPYEECIRVPFVVRAPGAPATPRTCAEPVLNIDVAPTLAALAGIVPPRRLDGVRFDAWLTGSAGPPTRTDFLLEHFRTPRSAILTYAEQVVDGDRLRLLTGDPGVRPRSGPLFEFDEDGQVDADAARVAIGTSADLTFSNLAAAASAQLPRLRIAHHQDANVLGVSSRQDRGLYFAVERDQAAVMNPTHPPGIPPDYLGVRDVAQGYTYVEYETGERELYDLNRDPFQLDNKASDPAYSEIERRLASRLEELSSRPPDSTADQHR